MKRLLIFVPVLAAAGAYAQVSLGKPVTASSFYNQGTETFPESNLTDGRFDDTGSPSNWSFWLTAQGENSGYATVDLGQNYLVSSVDLQDTHNRGYYDRGSRDFTIDLSTDGTHFHTVEASAFSQSEWLQLTHKTFNLNDTARYVRVSILNGWGGNSVGLNEISVFGQPTPEPGTMAALGLGAVALLRRRKK